MTRTPTTPLPNPIRAQVLDLLPSALREVAERVEPAVTAARAAEARIAVLERAVETARAADIAAAAEAMSLGSKAPKRTELAARTELDDAVFAAEAAASFAVARHQAFGTAVHASPLGDAWRAEAAERQSRAIRDAHAAVAAVADALAELSETAIVVAAADGGAVSGDLPARRGFVVPDRHTHGAVHPVSELLAEIRDALPLIPADDEYDEAA